MNNWLLKTEFQMEEAMGDSATQEPHGIWSEIDDWRSKVFEKPLQRWRKASIAITVCNRMRLVLESSHPVDKTKQKQRAISSPLTVQLNEINSRLTVPLTVQQLDEINSFVTVPTLDEASSQAQRPGHTYFGSSISAEKRHAIEMFLDKFHIVGQSFTEDGLLSLAVESRAPMITGSFPQVAGELHFFFEGPQHAGPRNPMLVTAPSPNRDVLDWLPEINEGAEYHVGSDDEFLGSSSHSATGMMFNMDDHNPLTPESAMSVQLWDDSPPVADNPAPLMRNTAGPTVTHSDSASMLDAGSGMESRQYDQISEPLEVCDLDQQLKKLRNEELWEEKIAMMKGDISKQFADIDHASDRLKLYNIKVQVVDIQKKLREEVETFEKHITRFVEQLLTTAKRHSHSVPNIQLLTKAISTEIKRFKEKELKHLLDEVGKISGRLEKVVRELNNREGSAMKVFQSCAESLQLLFVSRLEKHRHEFIWVPDFSKWYKEVYSLHNFRLDGR